MNKKQLKELIDNKDKHYSVVEDSLSERINNNVKELKILKQDFENYKKINNSFDKLLEPLKKQISDNEKLIKQYIKTINSLKARFVKIEKHLDQQLKIEKLEYDSNKTANVILDEAIYGNKEVAEKIKTEREPEVIKTAFGNSVKLGDNVGISQRQFNLIRNGNKRR